MMVIGDTVLVATLPVVVTANIGTSAWSFQHVLYMTALSSEFLRNYWSAHLQINYFVL